MVLWSANIQRVCLAYRIDGLRTREAEPFLACSDLQAAARLAFQGDDSIYFRRGNCKRFFHTGWILKMEILYVGIPPGIAISSIFRFFSNSMNWTGLGFKMCCFNFGIPGVFPNRCGFPTGAIRNKGSSPHRDAHSVPPGRRTGDAWNATGH